MPQDPTPVRRCVCADVTFSDLKTAGVRNLEEAGERFGVGLNCRSCVPYVSRMLATGETAFAVIPLPNS